MATGQYIGINGVARKVTAPYIGVNGVARNVKSGYVGVDGVARLFFAPEGGGAVVLEVEKVTSDTYANETTYTAEEFILLDIYPKTGGTVNVTYGGLTKTITDTSGAEEPNAQQVFFGTFNGVSDSVETPASGTLTIDGDYYAFGCGEFSLAKLDLKVYDGVAGITSFGAITAIPTSAFGSTNHGSGIPNITEIDIPDGVESIGTYAFIGCSQLINVTIPASVKVINDAPFEYCDKPNFVEIDSGNTAYKIDGNCLIEIATNKIIQGFEDSVIPSYITCISHYAFAGYKGLTTITIPVSVTSMYGCFTGCEGLTSIIMLATTPPTLDNSTSPLLSGGSNTTIIVPKGCGKTYKAADGWSTYSERIVEAS